MRTYSLPLLAIFVLQSLLQLSNFSRRANGFEGNGLQTTSKPQPTQPGAVSNIQRLTTIIERMRGGKLSARSKRRKRRNSAKVRDPEWLKDEYENHLERQRLMERRLYPHLFPPPLKYHPARVAMGLDPPNPEPPSWQKHNLELQIKYGTLWYPRRNISDEVQPPLLLPGERTKRIKFMDEYAKKIRVHQEFMLKNLFNATRDEIVFDKLDHIFQPKKLKRHSKSGPLEEIGKITLRPRANATDIGEVATKRVRLRPKFAEEEALGDVQLEKTEEEGGMGEEQFEAFKPAPGIPIARQTLIEEPRKKAARSTQKEESVRPEEDFSKAAEVLA